MPQPLAPAQRYRSTGPAYFIGATLRGSLLWTIVLTLAVANLSLQAIFYTLRTLFQLSFRILVYTLLAALFVTALVLMLGIQSLGFNTGNIP